MNAFNLQPYLTRRGIDYQSLLIFCLLWGMGGSFISLMLSKKMAKWLLGVHPIDIRSSDHKLAFFRDIVQKQAIALGIKTPEIGIFESSVPNAFATGPSRSNSLVAISRGLLNQLSEDELEAVIGHEMSHIANGDMVTMTLLQGIINAFVMFLARILAYFFASGRDRNSSPSFGAYYLFTFIFELVFMLLGSIALCAFSRFREYRADKGGAELAGSQKMISALEAIERASGRIKRETQDREGAPASMQALMIHPAKGSILLQLFSTHPSIEKRIERLRGTFAETIR